MDRAKVIEDMVPPNKVKAHFDDFYQIEALPSALMEVGILCSAWINLDISHS